MSPELHVAGLVIVYLAVAYLFIYPRVPEKTTTRLAQIGIVLLMALLGTAGSVYFGAGTSFTLLFVETWWWVYTLVLAIVLELPLSIWFIRKWDIDLDGPDK